MNSIAHAVQVLEAHGVVACATDTFIGLLAAFDDSTALDRLWAIKQRPAQMSVALIAADVESAWSVLEASEPARSWAKRWPGPVTLVGTPARTLDPRLLVNGKVGVRVPAPCDACTVAAALGRCVTATSANVHGEPSPAASEALSPAIRAGLADGGYIVEGAGPGGLPSALVDVETGRVIRPGHGVG